MTRTRLVALAGLAALALAASACNRAGNAPCAKLAAEICDNGSAADCTAFVDGEMVARHEEISDKHKQIACQTVLDDPPTVAALQRAFEGRSAQSASGGVEKKNSASK